MFETWAIELKFAVAFFIVLAVITLSAWLVRRLVSRRVGIVKPRGRQHRLGIIDAVSVDGRRRLILVRRDNVEHLIMIGGPADVVVEANMVRTRPPARDSEASKTRLATRSLPDSAPLGDESLSPMQSGPTSTPRIDALAEKAPQRHEFTPPSIPLTQEDAASLAPIPQSTLQRRAAPAQDPLVAIADEITRSAQVQPELATLETRVARREPRMTRTQAAAPPPTPPLRAPAGEAELNSPADQDIAEMRQRLESSLHGPAEADQSPRAVSQDESG
jgi:flagellar protein FliO/FliZ